MARHHVKIASAQALIDWPHRSLAPVPSSARASVLILYLPWAVRTACCTNL